MPRVFQCPFFKWLDGRAVHCEAGRVEFDQAAYKDYADRYCGNETGWRHCTLAQNLCRDYERRHEHEAAECGQDQAAGKGTGR